MQLLGATLRALREAAGLKQSEVAAWMTRHYKPTKSRVISTWETDEATPNAYYLICYCELFEVHDAARVFGGAATLNAEGLAKLREYTALLMESPRYTVTVPPVITSTRMLRFYEPPVSAGYGQFMDSARFENREVGNLVPAEATFAVWIAGNSMEPDYKDRQWIYVKEQNTIEPGQVGIVIYGDESYCKQLGAVDGKPALISLNPDYPPIIITMPDDLWVQGLVVGKGGMVDNGLSIEQDAI